MDVEKLIERMNNHLQSLAAYSDPELAHTLEDAATALSTLQAENESLKEKLYDGEGVNLVDYWMQQAKIEENGHRNCQAENENLRTELEQVKQDLGAAVKCINTVYSYILIKSKTEEVRTIEKWRRGPKED